MARHISQSGLAVLVFGAFAYSSCSGDSPAEKPPPAPPGPTSIDPEHCVFEKPPLRAPTGPAAPSSIKAGYGSAVLSMPIGAPLGGYGDRVIPLGGSQAIDTRAKRFATSMVPSA